MRLYVRSNSGKRTAIASSVASDKQWKTRRFAPPRPPIRFHTFALRWFHSLLPDCAATPEMMTVLLLLLLAMIVYLPIAQHDAGNDTHRSSGL